MKMPFYDGLKDFLSGYANERAATNRNSFVEGQKLGREQLRAIYKVGITSKIFRLLTGYALNDTMIFETEEDKKIFTSKMAHAFRRAAIYQLAFGRGIIVINEVGSDLSKPKEGPVNPARVKFDVFSGDETTALDVDYDLASPRYYQPKSYQVRGYQFHWTRVIDLTYFEPIEFEKPIYLYGGISLPELIYNQLINDSVIERASASIVEKNSTLFYKVKNFKQNIQNKQEKPMLEYFSRLEDARSIYGAGLIDAEDEAFSVDQSLSNLKDADDISLRRLAMVTGIPLPFLVGENVKGLNSAGDTERDTLNDTVNAYQDLYLVEKLNQFANRCGLGLIEFKPSLGMNANEQASYDTKIIDNAVKLTAMGQDGQKYLEKHGVIEKDDFEEMFPDDGDDLMPDENMLADPDKSINEQVEKLEVENAAGQRL
jgi:hypothetical protein